MNLFNRVALILLCVSIIVLAGSIIVLAWTIPNRTIAWLQDAADWLAANDGDMEKAILTAISTGVGLIAAIVLIAEFLPRRSGGDARVTGLAGGNATLPVSAVSERIEEAVATVPNVSEVRADVQAYKQGVVVEMDLHVEPDANLARVTDEACAAAEQVLTERLHVALMKPPVAHLRYRDGGNGRRVTTAPVAASTPVTVPQEAPVEPPSDERLPPPPGEGRSI